MFFQKNKQNQKKNLMIILFFLLLDHLYSLSEHILLCLEINTDIILNFAKEQY